MLPELSFEMLYRDCTPKFIISHKIHTHTQLTSNIKYRFHGDLLVQVSCEFF
jgi:hypothetical protein